MKKIASTLLAVVLVSLMLTACGGGNGGSEASQTEKAPYQVFLEAAQKHDNAKAVAGSVKMDATVFAGFETIKVATNVDLVRNLTDIDNPLLFLYIYFDNAGETSDMTIYYYGGNMYADTMGTKIKRTLPLSEIFDETELNALPAPLFDETKIKDAKVTDENGGKTITFTVIEPTSHEYMKHVTTSYTDAFESDGHDPTKLSVTADDMVVTAFVDADGVLKNFSFDLAIKLKYEGESVEIKMNIVVTIDEIENVTVPKPENESAYMAA